MKKDDKKKRPDLFDHNAPDTPHVEPKGRRSQRRVVQVDGKLKRDLHHSAHKREVAEYNAMRVILANEHVREEKPDYGAIFDFPSPPPVNNPQTPKNAPKSHYTQMEADLRGVIRHVLGEGITYEQIKAIVVSEIKYHQSLLK